MKMFPPRPVLATALLTSFLFVAQAQPYTFGTGVGSAANPGSNDGTNDTAQFTAPQIQRMFNRPRQGNQSGAIIA